MSLKLVPDPETFRDGKIGEVLPTDKYGIIG